MSKCIHHWMCDVGEDGKVPARCKKCGAETIFKTRYKVGFGHEYTEGNKEKDYANWLILESFEIASSLKTNVPT